MSNSYFSEKLYRPVCITSRRVDVRSVGGSENPKAFIFLMDYANSQRVKLWGTAKVVEDDAALLDQLRDPDYPGKVERAIVFTIEAWDINCPQHIHKRFSQSQIAPVVEEMKAKIADLESRLAQALVSNKQTNLTRNS